MQALPARDPLPVGHWCLQSEVRMKVLRLSVPALLGSVSLSALADVPAGVTTALGDMKTDALAVATLVLVAIIAVAAFKFMRRGI